MSRRVPPLYTVSRGNGVTDHGAKTLAALQALGSSVVSVGDVAWDTANERWVSAIEVNAGDSVWGERWEHRGSWTVGVSGLRYLRFGGGTTNASITGLEVLPTERPLRITRIRYAADSDPGSTDIGIYSARTTLLEAVTVGTTGAATFRNWDFTADAEIPANGELSIGITPTNTPNAFSLLVLGYRL